MGDKEKKQPESVRGITIRGNSLRLSFSYKGKRYRPTLKLEPTLKNIKYAEDRLRSIKALIATNQFDLEKHFPNLVQNKEQAKTVNDFIKQFLKLKKTELDPNTINGYQIISELVNDRFGDDQVAEISRGDILLWRSNELATKYSNKYINNIFTVLRGAFELALSNDHIEVNPMNKIKNLRLKNGSPNPFTRSEIKLLLEHPTNKLSEQNYIEYTCWTGNRSAEALALAWEDINLENRTATINRSIVSGQYKRTKTGKSRKITLLEPAYQALLKQKEISGNLKPKQYRVLEKDNKTYTIENLRIVFLNSNTMLPFNDVSVYGKVFWDRHLKQAGVAHRGANQCRHTYASQLLSTGRIRPEKVALEMGTSMAMLDKHYGKYIDEDALDHRKQMEDALFDDDPTSK